MRELAADAVRALVLQGQRFDDADWLDLRDEDSGFVEEADIHLERLV